MTSNIVLTKFGQRLRALREAEGMSQEFLASQAGMHRTYLSGIERGERNVSLVNIVKISRALQVSTSLLVEGID